MKDLYNKDMLYDNKLLMKAIEKIIRRRVRRRIIMDLLNQFKNVFNKLMRLCKNGDIIYVLAWGKEYKKIKRRIINDKSKG